MKRRPATQLGQRPNERRPWQRSSTGNKSVTSPLQNEIATIARHCARLEQENKRLTALINAFKSTKKNSAVLKAHFDERLSQLENRVMGRLAKLGDIEFDAKAACLRLNPEQEDPIGKTQLLDENARLVQIALYQEQATIVDRLKLKVFHDHRKIQCFKSLFQKAKKGEEIDVVDENAFVEKLRLRILKDAIEYEKWRIAVLRSPQYRLNEAATIIQKTWRGYIQRLRERGVYKGPYSHRGFVKGWYKGGESVDVHYGRGEYVDHLFDVTGIPDAVDASAPTDPDAPAPAGEAQ